MAKKKKRTHSWTARKVKALRDRLDITQAKAAALVGVTRRQWAAWEAGESVPSGPAAKMLQLLHERGEII